MSREVGPYGRLARFVLGRRLAVGLSLLLAVVVAALLALPPKVDPDMLALLPDDDPAASALKELHHAEGGLSLLTIALQSDDEAALTGFVAQVTDELAALPRVQFAVHEVDPALAERVGLLQLPASDVRELSARMKGALALGPALNPIVTQRLMDMGPVTERIAAAGDAGPFLGGEPGRARILVKPTGSSHDQPFATALMHDVHGVLDAAQAREPSVEVVWVGGAYRHSVEDRIGIQQDLLWTSVASLLLVLTLIAVSFRSLRATVIVMVPLVGANVLNLSLATALFGPLNTYTSFGTAILVGLGIDFAVHLVGRYRELRSTGLGKDDAIIAAWDRTGPPCTTAALTSSAGFLALVAASFQGFAQLGALLAIGLMLCLLAMLLVLPILLSTLDDSTRPLFGSPKAPTRASRSTYRLAPMGLMVAVLATGTIGAMKLPELAWEFDLSVMRRGGLAYDELDATERALARDSYTPIVVTYDTREELAAAHRSVEARIADGQLTHLARAVSVESVLPSDQAARLEALTELQGLLSNPNLRYLPPPLVQRLLPLRDASLGLLDRSDLPGPLLDLVGAGAAGQHRLLLFPRGNMWDIREAAALSDEAAEAFAGRRPAGEYLALGSLYRTLMRDMPIVAALALLMVGVLTAIDLRRTGWIAAALGTLLAGMIWAGAAVETFGVKLSMINVVGVPILLGIGVDVVIHLLHRLKEEGPGGVRRAMTTTGVAASVSTLTTIASFLSLTLAGNRGVQSLGVLVVIGLLAGFVVSAVLLPLVWAAGWRVTGRAPGDPRRIRIPPLRKRGRDRRAGASTGDQPGLH